MRHVNDSTLTQQELAARCGVRQNHISRLETDAKVDIRFTTIAKIAAILGLSLDELAVSLGYRPEMPQRLSRSATLGDQAILAESLKTLAKTLASAQIEISNAAARLQDPSRARKR